MQWKPDWGMRWAALEVDYEMFGKDLIPSAELSSRICRVLGTRPPELLNYELFNDEHGQKISKSKGNGLSLEDWLAYAAQESLAYFMYLKPRTAKRLYFDVIPKAVDEYHQHLRAFEGQDDAERLANPVFHVHSGNVPTSNLIVPYSMLLNLASVSGAEDKDRLWGFIKRYAPDAAPDTHPDLDAAAEFAIAYFNDLVRPHRTYRAPEGKERAALTDLKARLESWPGSKDAEEIQSMVYAVGREHGFDPLRDWFKALYEVLLGASQGPRFGVFIALYGVDETAALIEQALEGKLA